MINDDNFTWIESGGGPLLLLPEALLSAWEGAKAPTVPRVIEAQSRWKEGGPATDYDRACDLRTEIDVLEVGSGYGLVLGDEPLPTSWKSAPERDGGLLIRWVSAEGDDEVANAVEHVPPDLFTEPTLVVEFDHVQLHMFDAALPGESGRIQGLRVELKPGLYAVDSARYTPDFETELLLHRLTRIG